MARNKNCEAQSDLNGYRELIENMGDILFSLDVEGNVVSVSQAVRRVLGFEPREVVGRNVSEFIAEEALPQVKMNCARIRTGEALTPETTIYRKDGEVRHVRYSSIPLKRGSEVVGSQGIIRDITMLKQTEMELNETIDRERKFFERVVPGLIAAVESRDLDTAGHQLRVAQLTEAIAVEMGFSDDEVNGLRTAASLHDIGKMYVPPQFLTKTGPLNGPEKLLVQLHPQVAHGILQPIGFPWPVAKAALQHHEREDGSGYPGGLKGDQILIESDVIAVADVFEAMCSNRPYRPAPGRDAAIKEISTNKGKNGGAQFHPDVVKACLRVVRRGFKFRDVPRPLRASDFAYNS